MPQVLTNPAQLGQIITDRRKARKISQQTLAQKLSISQNRLSELEAEPNRLTIERLLTLANILDLEILIQEKKTSGKAVEW